ncbi:hypothetical protein JRQ81_002565 [Phrynocephalus forsythii]|uniref:receptor protein-tyrosine kinase n=1 Tax=Phrynocephalus forsythii TaxID=171643 RepID=A0A9Q0XKC9_9SAUR|nr:hypothetical protein JRQ81_002565 [Phrynocephalus forsythii]
MEPCIPGAMGPAVLVLLVTAICHGLASPTIAPNGSTLVVEKDNRVSLFCSGNASVEWIGLKNDSKTVIYNNGTLYIPRATCKNMRNYQCAYVNSTDKGIASVYLFVKDPASLWCRPRMHVDVPEGSDALLPCLITDPDFKGSVSLVKHQGVSSAFSFRAQEGMWLQKVNLSDSGWYYCQAQIQGQRVDSPKINLSVREISIPVSVSIATKDNVRIQGEPFNITCRISYPSHVYKTNWTCPPSANVTVLRNEYDIMDETSKKYITDLILYTPTVQFQDSGTYTCFGASLAGTSHSSATLRVIENGYLYLSTTQRKNQELSLRDSLELEVLIEAYPKPYLYGWTHINPSKSLRNSTCIGQMSFGNNRYNNTLKLTYVEEEHNGMYTFFADNGEASASITFNISVRIPPKARLKFNSSDSLFCEASGYPAPHIEWYKLSRSHKSDRCDQGGMLIMNDTSPQIVSEIPFGRVSLTSSLRITKAEGNETYCCLAINNAGNESDYGPLHLLLQGRDDLGHISKTVIMAWGGTMAFLLLCIAILFYKYKQKPKYQVHWKIIDACDGNNYTFIDPTQLPYNEKWEFPRNNLQFGKILGAGAFGKVVEATAFGLGKEDSVMKVAVKMLKSTAHTDEQEALMSELKIMSHLGHHENIVNLLGACTHGGPVLVITEYCPYGDLLNFLRQKTECIIIQDLTLDSSTDSTAADYKNIYLGKKYVQNDSGFGSQCVENYLEMRAVIASDPLSGKDRSLVVREERTDSHPLGLHDLLQFSSQVAQGMSFLASKNCIHRDLAARNVLVADGRVAKICDFGLARDIMNDANYVVKGNARLPVKWMAPESIFECVYTVQSDVWSYGILLWEIFSLGRSPYPGMKVNSKFYQMVKQGYYMGRPDFAPDDIYHIMTACWNLEPTRRPTFQQICTLLQKHLDDSRERDYKNLPRTTEEEDSGCEPSSYCEESCDSGESGQPLLSSNNYQFC